MKKLERFQNIIVTGGAGFIGSNLVRKIIKRNNINLFIFDKLGYSSDFKSIDKLIKEKNSYSNSKINFNKVNLANFEETKSYLLKANPDLIFHLAAETHVDRSIDNPIDFLESNLVGTFNILQSSKMYWEKLPYEKKKLFKFIHVSTDEVFGSLGMSGQFNEKTAYNPSSPYSATKAGSDHLVHAWFKTYGFPSITSNCSNNFGPWQFPEKLIPLVILKGIKGEEIPLFGDGKNVRDWLYVEDHVDALITIADIGIAGEKYCIGGSNEISNREVIEKICAILDKKYSKNKPHRSLIKHVNDRPGHDLRYSIDSSKIKKVLGWEEKYNFSEGLLKTIEWYLDNLDWCIEIQKESGYDGKRLGLNLGK